MEANETLAFDALSDGVRRRILAVLGEAGELSVGEISSRVAGVGRTTISSHLRVLRTSGVVTERRAGRNHFYCLDTEGSVRDALAYLQTILHDAVTAAADGIVPDFPAERSGESHAG